MKNFEEKLDAYLSENMDSASKTEFLKEVSQDSELQNRLNFEQEVVGGIKEARVLDIKSNLSSIPISYQLGLLESVGSLKVALYSGIVIGLLGITGYYLLSENNDVDNNNEVVESAEGDFIFDIYNENNEGSQEESTLSEEVDSEVQVQESNPETIQDFVVDSKPAQNVSTPESTSENDLIDASNEIETFNPSVIEPEDNFSIPSSTELNEISKSESVKGFYESTTIEKVDDGIHDFHYKFYNRKLFLYGSFNKSPYEIIELNGENGRQYFLYYDNSFYPLDRDRKEIDGLVALNDSSLEAKLKKLKD